MRTLSVAALQSAPVAPRPRRATLALFGERLAGVRATVPGVDLVLAPELHLSGQPGPLEEQSGYPDEVAVPVPGPLTDAPLRPRPISTGSGSSRATVFERGRRRSHPQHGSGLLPRDGEMVARLPQGLPPGSHTRSGAPGDNLCHLRYPRRLPSRARDLLRRQLPGGFPSARLDGPRSFVLQPTPDYDPATAPPPSWCLPQANAIVKPAVCRQPQRPRPGPASGEVSWLTPRASSGSRAGRRGGAHHRTSSTSTQ